MGGKMANRVSDAGVAGQRKGLAAASAEILVASRTGPAWLLHPLRAAKRIEGRRSCPDVAERMIAHRPEFESGDAFRRMARQNPAGRRDIERAAAPAADARLRVARIIVRNHRIDD